MVKFAFKNFEDKYPKWAKHHEMVGLHVKRVYEDGKVVTIEDKELKPFVEKYENFLLEKAVDLYIRKENKRISVTDYYLPLYNLELKKPVNYFQSGGSNTKQKMSVRYKFMLENSLFILEHSINTVGNYPLLELVDESSIEEAIRDVAKNSNVKVDGIGTIKEEEDMFSVVVVDECGDADIIDIELQELLDHLIAVEVFEYEMTIKD